MIGYGLWFAAADSVRAAHVCDPAIEPGWAASATEEVTHVADSAPLQACPGDWYVERTTTRLPLCNYFNGVGNYSLQSYSLDPYETKTRVAICGAGPGGTSVAVAPYAGPCPPK